MPAVRVVFAFVAAAHVAEVAVAVLGSLLVETVETIAALRKQLLA